MMTPYLSFAGNCEEALDAYQSIFGGTIESLNRYEGSPMETQVPADFKEKIMHATLASPLGTLMASDSSRPLEPGSQISISISPSAAEAERVFNGLADGGKVEMPLQEVFWGGKFGMLTDRFGIDWLVSVAPAEH
jgi:PhnB protein